MGYRYLQNGEILGMSDLVNRMEDNAEASRLIKKARGNYVLATILGASGGFLIGWPLGTVLAGGEPQWYLAGIGVGLVGLSIPISIRLNKQVQGAIHLYNEDLAELSGSVKLNLHLSACSAGLILEF